MTGNDVVDLQLASRQSNWGRKGFLEKVFTTAEQEDIRRSGNLHLRVWLLWSMKEAAYKAHQRRFDLSRRLNWKDQQCQLKGYDTSHVSGIVQIGNRQYYTSSHIDQEVVFTSAVAKEKQPVRNRLFKDPSTIMKQHFLREFSTEFRLIRDHLELRKNSEGVPMLYYQNEFFQSSFSFTGHGEFCGFSFPLTNC